jgi:hypothetical protein
MNPFELVETLAGKGVRLSVEGGDLKCRGPKSALTPETLARLKAHKAEVIAHLLPAPEAPPVEPPKVTPEQVRAIMENPPYWLAGSYIPAYESGRYSLEVLAYGVVAACGGSAYDEAAVDVAMNTLVNLGYGEGAAAVWV